MQGANILYEIQDQDLTVTVSKVGHRRDVYLTATVGSGRRRW
jgi:mRNA-degrading endonuclease RelE of RelBE toxin-antitoxin system